MSTNSAKPNAPPGYTDAVELGEGGMGRVFKAKEAAGLGRTVALKMIRPRFSETIESKARFDVECKALASLVHPNIIRLYGVHFWEEENQHYMVLDFCEGGSLQKYLVDNGPLNAVQAVKLLTILSRAVHYFHGKNVLHRDLKPDNVFLCGGTNSMALDAPMLGDFGIAKLLDETGLTRTGDVFGSPDFMAPEQKSSGGTATPQTDVYGLGAILCECLTQWTLAREIGDPRNARIGWLESLDVKVPRCLKEICKKCLEENPQDRFSNAGELADALENCGERLMMRRASNWRGVAVAIFAIVMIAFLMLSCLWYWFGSQSAQRLDVVRVTTHGEKANSVDNRFASNGQLQRVELTPYEFGLSKGHVWIKSARLEIAATDGEDKASYEKQESAMCVVKPRCIVESGRLFIEWQSKAKENHAVGYNVFIEYLKFP